MGFTNEILTGKDIASYKKIRKNQYIYDKINQDEVPEFLNRNWIIDKELKSSIRVKKEKNQRVQNIDNLWVLFANLGFDKINKFEKFSMQYSDCDEEIYKFDVFAADEETAIFVKYVDKNESNSLLDTIQDLSAITSRANSEIKKILGKGIVPIFIVFASDHVLTEIEKNNIAANSLHYFDDDMVNYYKNLQKHLGMSAKYQLQGNILQGKKVKNLKKVIPAIRGKMGGHTYYSFSIEPDNLLKIGYVLHQNNANKDDLPSYQRLIKKNRLVSISEFINRGRYFPNSILINFETRKELRFDLSKLQDEKQISKLGLLHLPQEYKSAYIIDGQHRLYAYANSKYKNDNTIPVVAFVNLEKSEQVKLFMEINENQKAVSKNLRTTLESYIYMDSEDLKKQRTAIGSKIAQKLGESEDSPLYGRVIIGENVKTKTCCLTLDMIKRAIEKSGYLNIYDRSGKLVKEGIFDFNDSLVTINTTYEFIKLALDKIKKGLETEWEKGEDNDGYISINVSISAYIKIILDLLIYEYQDINLIKYENLITLTNKIEKYLDIIITFLKELPSEDGLELRKTYGGNGVTRYWRTLQKAINSFDDNFIPDGYTKYWKDNDKRYNVESFEKIREIELYLKNSFKVKLNDYYGENWLIKGLPKKTYEKINKLASDKAYDEQREVNPWEECLLLIDYREIAIYTGNWDKLFSKDFTYPIKIGGDKKNKTKWLEKLNKIRNKNSHLYSVSEEDYKFIISVYDWLIKD